MTLAANLDVVYEVKLNGVVADTVLVSPAPVNPKILYNNKNGWSGLATFIVVSAATTDTVLIPTPPTGQPMPIPPTRVKTLDSVGLGVLAEGDTSGPLPCLVSISGSPPITGTIELILKEAGQNKVDAQ